jgi:hypothetical protein
MTTRHGPAQLLVGCARLGLARCAGQAGQAAFASACWAAARFWPSVHA